MSHDPHHHHHDAPSGPPVEQSSPGAAPSREPARGGHRGSAPDRPGGRDAGLVGVPPHGRPRGCHTSRGLRHEENRIEADEAHVGEQLAKSGAGRAGRVDQVAVQQPSVLAGALRAGRGQTDDGAAPNLWASGQLSGLPLEPASQRVGARAVARSAVDENRIHATSVGRARPRGHGPRCAADGCDVRILQGWTSPRRMA